jgi:WD40 repeat protein
VQTATAAESAVVIQVGGDLYLSDAALGELWAPRQPATPGECPYPGLDAFGPSQAKWFFGRDNVTGDLLRYLDQMARGGPGGPLLVVAPSGTGKSSLLGAGLLTALAEGRLAAAGSATWPRVMITPGPRPARTLRTALESLAKAPPPGEATTRAPRGAAGELAGGLAAQQVSPQARIILVIDQLEEIFTLCESEAERTGFLDEIGTLAADAGPGSALVVLGMRADFYGRATAYPVLRQAMQSRQVVLGAMTATEVRQAIVRPARAVGLTLESGLVERLLHDLGVEEPSDGAASAQGGHYEPGRLPLLAHALRATWQRRDGNRLSVAGYEATGGIAGAIAQTAEDVYATLGAEGQAATRQLFLALVRVGAAPGAADTGSDAADTRRRVAAAALLSQAADPAATRRALEAFTAARLLTSGGQAVEITHEALLRRWPRLRAWIDEDRSGLYTRQEVEAAAATWAREGKDAGSLYGGVRLATAQAWAGVPEHARELTAAARDFLAASERRRRRGTRRRNAVIAVLAALSLVLAGLAVFARSQRDDAQHQRAVAQANFQRAEASALAAVSGQAWGDFRPDAAMLFAVQASRLDPGSPQVRDALLATEALPLAGRLLQPGNVPDPTDIVSVAYNPAGTLIAGSTQDDKVQLWDPGSYRRLWSFQFPAVDGGHSQADAIAFTPDGRTLLVTQPGGIWMFNIANPARPVHTGTLVVPSGTGKDGHPQVVALAVSPDGTTVAAGVATSQTAFTGLLLTWNLAARTLSGVFPETSLASTLAYTPDGRSLVAGTDGGAVEVFDAARRVKVATALAAGASALGPEPAVAVSPDGKTIAYGYGDSKGNRFVKLWSTVTRQVTQTIKAGTAFPQALAFSRQGTQLAAGFLDGTVKLWDLTDTGGPVGTFAGHRALVHQIAFSPDGKRLASASGDGTIALWDTQGTTLGGRRNGSIAVAFSPDGKTLAMSVPSVAGPAIALYSMPARKLTGLLAVKGVASLAFSPDGQTLAVAPDNTGGVVQLWSVPGHQVTGTLRTGMASRIASIAFSPDGRLLAVSALQSPTMQVWSTSTLRQVVPPVSVSVHTNLPMLSQGVFALAFSPDGRYLAVSGADAIIRLYNVPTFTLANYFRGVQTSASLAFSPDGHWLALASDDGSVYLIPVREAPRLALYPQDDSIFEASAKTLFGVQFISGNRLIAGGEDGNVRFWTIPSHLPREGIVVTIPDQVIATHGGLIGSLSYSAPLGLVVTGSSNGTRVWDAEPGRVAASACRSLKQPIRKSLWQDYLPRIQYTPVC